MKETKKRRRKLLKLIERFQLAKTVVQNAPSKKHEKALRKVSYKIMDAFGLIGRDCAYVHTPTDTYEITSTEEGVVNITFLSGFFDLTGKGTRQ